jgi:hypothetical protein
VVLHHLAIARPSLAVHPPFDFIGLGRIGHFPSFHHSLQSFLRHRSLAVPILREQAGRVRFNIDNANLRAIVGEKIDQLPAYVAAQVRSIPGEITGLAEKCAGLFARSLNDRALVARRLGFKGFANRVKRYSQEFPQMFGPSQPSSSSICRFGSGSSGGLGLIWERTFLIPSASA